MKLYSTITSERATKAQGANKSILATFTAEIENDRKKVVEVAMIYRENKTVYIEIQAPNGETLRYTL